MDITLEQILAVALYAYARRLQCDPENAMDDVWNVIADEMKNYDPDDPTISVVRSLKRMIADIEAMIRAIYDVSGPGRSLMLEKAARALEVVKNHS